MTKEEYEWHKERVETAEDYPPQVKAWMLKNLEDTYAAEKEDAPQEQKPKPPEEMNWWGA
jgi:hypothetical protein